MGHGKRLEADVGVQRKWLAVSQVENADRKSRIEQPFAVAFGKRAQQLHDARGPENDEWLTARRLGRVLEGVHEHRQLTPVIRVEMGQDNVRYLMPGQPELGEPVRRAEGATVPVPTVTSSMLTFPERRFA